MTSRTLVEVGFAFGMHFVQAARDGLGEVDLVVNGTHQKDLVNELGNEFLPCKQYVINIIKTSSSAPDARREVCEDAITRNKIAGHTFHEWIISRTPRTTSTVSTQHHGLMASTPKWH